MLEKYYDINYKDKFEELFKGTYIFDNQTKDKNSYLTIKFDFSAVNPNLDKLETSFENRGNSTLEDFLTRYEHLFHKNKIEKILSHKRFEDRLIRIFYLISESNLKLYLFIDEYDNFSNTILSTYGSKAYSKFTHGAGFFRHFFNMLKSGTSSGGAVSRLFITGVSPITMDDVTSGFNIGSNIFLNQNFNEIIGFSETDVKQMLEYYKSNGMLSLDISKCLNIMVKWYNNYKFSKRAETKMFNSDMVLYFMKEALLIDDIPEFLLDKNIKTDYEKLRHLIITDKGLNGNFSVLKKIIEEQEIISQISDGFPLESLTDSENFISLLYYFGLLTIEGPKRTRTLLKIPNLTIKDLMYSYIRRAYKDTNKFTININDFSLLLEDMAYDGRWEEVFEFINKQVEKQSSIRDFIEGEKFIQTFLLVYLNITDCYIIKTEKELNKGYCDLFLEPFLIKYPDIKYSYLIELKYIKRSEFTQKLMEEKIIQGKEQLEKYCQSSDIIKTTCNTTLKKIILIYNAWELVYKEEIN